MDLVEPVLELRGITKRFDGIAVLHSVDFDVRAGEVHALVGENGAGKTTLMKVAAGVYEPDEGRVLAGGRLLAAKSPMDARRAGIAMVHQELSLAPDLSVAENIVIGQDDGGGRFLSWRRLADRAAGMLSDFGLQLDPMQPVSSLGVGYQQVVEILKALAANPKIIIFDEPTASLEAHETAAVLDTIRKLASRSVGVVYISHRIEEVFRVGDRVTVLRDGWRIWTKNVSETTREEVVNAMVGREMTDIYPPPASETGDELLRVENLTRRGVFSEVSFALHRGEILGFSGLVGSGRTEVMRAVFGADPVDAGSVILDGQVRRFRSVREAMDAGLAYLPEDRKTLGLFVQRSVLDNVVCASLDRCSRRGAVRSDLCEDLAATYCEKLSIRARDTYQDVRSLSGGNQQKVLLARWMATDPKVLIVDEPTRGVDVGAKAEIHRMLRDYANAGHAVIVVSSEMPEIIGLCDRIIVMHEGRISGEVPRDQATEQQLISLAVSR